MKLPVLEIDGTAIMGTLENPRHEKFAQELAKGKTGDEAYVLAGYKQNKDNASRLKANESILGRIAELQERGSNRALVTLESLLQEAEEARAKAMELGQVSAAVAAIKEKGVLSGKRVEKRETGSPGDFDAMGTDELRDYVRREAEALGLGNAVSSHEGRKGSVRGKPSSLH